MFDAMVHRRIDTEGLEFDLSLADIEQLNAGALQGVPDISKLSYAVVPQLLDRYRVLHSGSALGAATDRCWSAATRIYPDEVSGIRVAIPRRAHDGQPPVGDVVSGRDRQAGLSFLGRGRRRNEQTNATPGC